MKNLFKKIADFFCKVRANVCNKSRSLWESTLDLWKKLCQRCNNAKNKIVNNPVIPVVVDKCKEFGHFVDDNRKVCYPVMLLIYTIVVVVITTSVNFSIIFKDDTEDVSLLGESMSDSASYPSTVYMEKGKPLTVQDKFDLCYEGYKFDKKIVPSKAEKYGAYYENHSDGNLYFDVVLTYTNRSERVVRCDEAVRAAAICAGVGYKSFVAAETEQGTNFEFAADKEITPGESVSIHCIFDVPSGMKYTGHDIEVEITADGKTYYIDITESR